MNSGKGGGKEEKDGGWEREKGEAEDGEEGGEGGKYPKLVFIVFPNQKRDPATDPVLR